MLIRSLGIIVRGLIVLLTLKLAAVDATGLQKLGQRIRDARKALGWTQEELADRAEIDRSYIGGVERGERNLTFAMLCQICSALRCDVAKLTKGIPEAVK